MTVTADALNVRFGPAESYNNIGVWLRHGDVIRVYFCRLDGWCKVDHGYVDGRYIEKAR